MPNEIVAVAPSTLEEMYDQFAAVWNNLQSTYEQGATLLRKMAAKGADVDTIIHAMRKRRCPVAGLKSFIDTCRLVGMRIWHPSAVDRFGDNTTLFKRVTAECGYDEQGVVADALSDEQVLQRFPPKTRVGRVRTVTGPVDRVNEVAATEHGCKLVISGNEFMLPVDSLKRLRHDLLNAEKTLRGKKKAS